MRDKVKRFISILMTALMLVNLMPVGALADGITSIGYQQATIANGNQTVYLYVKVTGNLNGLNLNKSGWCTVGKVTGLDMTDPQTYAWWYGSSNHVSSVSGISASSVGTGNKGNLTRYEKNQSIDLSKVTWSSGTHYGFLPVSNGADDYVGSGWTWHLDGYIDIAQVKASYKIRYVDQDTNNVLKIAASGTDDPGVWIDHSAPKTLDGGYEIVGDADRTFKLEQIDNTFDIYYRRQYGYKVEYYYDGVKDDKKTETGSAWCKDVIRQYTDKTDAGYEHEKTENLPLTIGTNESKNVIKVYYKKIGYTVTYEPGEHGDFEAKAYNAKHGDATPAFDGETTGKPGWTFDGWEPEVAETVTGNATYTAKFVPDKTKTATVLYTISIGQSDYGSIAPSAQQIILQATGKLDSDVGGSVSGSTATANAGYKFVGWYKATGEATYEWVTGDPELTSELAESKLNRDEETGLYQNTVFEARFEPDEKQTATVTYTAENGTVTHASDTILQADASGLTGSTATPNKGYKFDGWYAVDKNGDKHLISGLDPAEELDAETAKKNLNKDGNLYAETTFIARFVPDENQTVPVIYTTDENGILWGGPAIGSITYNVNIATGKVWLNNAFVDKLEPVPTYPKEGYEFDRWIRVSPETTIEGADSTLTDEMARPNLNKADDGLYQETEFKAIFKPRTNLSYTVNYYWNGTTEKVTESKTIGGKMFGEEMTESPVGVEGYTPVSTESQTITLGTGTNEINFYYYKNVELTANSRTLTYDGYEHGVSGFTGAPNVADFSDIKVEATGKNVGTYPAAFAEGTVGTVDKTEKYIVTKTTDGQLVIEKRNVTLTSEGGSKVYDGAPLTKPEVQIEGSFVDGEVLGIVAQGTVTDVSDGEVTNTIFFNPGANFKESNYNIVKNEGNLWITPRQVTLTSETASKEYDGNPLTKPDVTVTGDGFVKGEVTDIKAKGEVTHVSEGEVTNTITYTPVDGKFDADNYTITKKEGKLSITPLDGVVVEIEGRTKTVTYNGEEHTAWQYDVVRISDPLYEPAPGEAPNFWNKNAKGARGTDAGTYPMGWVAEDFENTNTNFSNVTFVVTDGQLVINKRPVTLTSADLTKVYEGTPLTNGDAPVTEMSGTEKAFPDGEGLDYDFTGSQTDVGESDNLFTFEVNANTNKDNYTFEVAIGTLKVNPVTDKVTVTVTEKSDTVTYDGMPHTVSGYASMTADNPLYDVENDVQETPNAAWAANGTDAGEYPLGIEAGDFKNINANFTNVEFVVVDGALTITPAPVTLQAPIASKTYDGTPLKAEDYGHSFVEGLDFADDFASISVEGSQTQAGSSVSQIKEVVPKKGKDLKNYKLTFLPGSLTIAKRSVLITSPSATKTYDGSALTRPAVTITGDGFVPGELAKAEATGSITNVGSTPNAIRYTTTGAFNAANYSIALSVGTLTVTEKPKPEPRRTFNLTINYVYQNGKRAAASYNRGGLKNGETFDITSPVIAGYTASETVVSGTIYNRDIKVTVIYTADGVNLDDYGVPLGLGNITMNVGDCFE